ncbi:MAG: putative sugar O-methyltransferase [Candidatus Melainabacteria bacterium]|nr:putative sugar O-methyltransferase [Candidatus Melainabacteria bacterium]
MKSELGAVTQAGDPEIQLMLTELAKSPPVYHPSNFWDHFLNLHLQQLSEDGIENFKRTVNQYYFNWTVGPHFDCQWQYLQAHTSIAKRLDIWLNIQLSRSDSERHPWFTEHQWQSYRAFLAYLWEFVSTRDKLDLLRQVEEPLLGSPLSILYKGRRISQDICNSTLELNGLAEGMGTSLEKAKVLEIGGGYGRVADLILLRYPGAQITMVDIPPALKICQWYLSERHSDRKIFKFRPFSDFSEVESEFNNASIRFLLPSQLELLPNDSFSACINISSFHEMI